jgi:hypothetical protein
MTRSQEQAFLSQFLQQGCDLGVLEFDDPLLALVHPARQGSDNQLPGLQEALHGRPLPISRESRPGSARIGVNSSD